MYTEQITQAMAIAAPVPPQAVTSATKTTGGVDMSLSRRFIGLLNIGTVTAGGSISAKLQESTDNSTFTDLAGSNVSLTALTTANKNYTFEVRAGQITKRYVRLSVTEGGGFAVQIAANAIGMEGDHKPNNANNDASVATQNVVS